MSGDLESRKWREDIAIIEFNPELMHGKAYDPPFLATYSKGGSKRSHRVAFRCLKCQTLVPLDQCPNCNSVEFKPGLDSRRIAGIFCWKCEKGYTYWKCQQCGTENPVKNTILGEPNKGCYIASSVYGDENHYKLDILREFRDTILNRSALGRKFIDLYYEFSPALAKRLNSHKNVNSLVRVIVIEPIVKIARILLKT